MSIALAWPDWLQLFLHFAGLSLLAVGGAITTAPGMHRYLVDGQGWLSDAQFAASIALAQAAPGPNILFVALMGWHVGLNAAGGLAAGASAVAVGAGAACLSLAGILLPSSLLNYQAMRWLHVHADDRAVRAFKQGLAPVVIGLMLATACLLVKANLAAQASPGQTATTVLLALASLLLVWRTRVHLLWLLGAGALAGALGWV